MLGGKNYKGKFRATHGTRVQLGRRAGSVHVLLSSERRRVVVLLDGKLSVSRTTGHVRVKRTDTTACLGETHHGLGTRAIHRTMTV